MSEKNQVYAVMSGEYSDRVTHAVFTEESAALECSALLGHGFRVEPLAMDPDVDALRKGLHVWSVTVSNGAWSAGKECAYMLFDMGRISEVMEWGKVTGLQVIVVADTEERALKAGMERIRQHRALAGVTNATQEQEEEAARQRVKDQLAKAERDERIRKEEEALKADRIYAKSLAMQKVRDGYQENEREIDARLDKEFGEKLRKLRSEA